VNHEIAIEIGGMPILLRTQDPAFRELLATRYSGFVRSSARARFEFDVELVNPSADMESDEDAQVQMRDGVWHVRRGDFRAQWNPRRGRGLVRQSANPYSIDSVLRILHSLILAPEGGFLLHAASAICNGRALAFSGISGAGKTTISGLAPPDVTLLTDEISYIRRDAGDYCACGTPFAGELARAGENCAAPLATVFLLEKGPQNRIDPVPQTEAVGALLRNVLFFAEDPELVNLLFRSVCEFVEQVPVRRLTFVPDARVWEMLT
jgi:hypothetical protein